MVNGNGSIWMQRNADVATIDARDILDDDGESTPPQAITVPNRAVLRRALMAVGFDAAAAGRWGTFGWLEGNGLPGSPYFFAGPGSGSVVATGNMSDMVSKHVPAYGKYWGIRAIKGQPVTCLAEFTGAGDIDAEVAIGLEFARDPLARTYSSPLYPLTFEESVTAVDTATLLNDLGDQTPNRVLPDGYTKLAHISYGLGFSHGAAGSAVALLHLSNVTSWLEGSDQRIPLGGSGGQAVQAGADNNVFVVEGDIPEVDVDVIDGASASVNGVMAGDDVGDLEVVVTLWLARA